MTDNVTIAVDAMGGDNAPEVVLEGVEVVDNALYFCAGRVSKGSWMAKNREYIETIGNHVFYY